MLLMPLLINFKHADRYALQRQNIYNIQQKNALIFRLCLSNKDEFADVNFHKF